MDDRCSSLIDATYAAALDETLWSEWVARAASAIGAAGATFAVVDADTGRMRQVLPLWGDADPSDYFRHYAPYDPQMAQVLAATRPTIYASEDYRDESVPETAEYMAWQRRAADFDSHLSIVAPLGDGNWRVAFSGHARVGWGPIAAAGRNLLQRLLPDLVRAWQLGFRHSEALTTDFWNGMAARAGGDAMLLLDERGCTIRSTDRALAILGAGDGLSLPAGELTVETPSEQADLAKVIARALRPRAPRAGAVRVSRRSGRRPFVVIAYPLARRRRFLAPFEAAAMVRIVDPVPSPGAPDLFREAYALTPREADLARLLGHGHSSESAAAVLGIALPTARIHLHRILGKTGTARQSELVQLYTRVGDRR